MSMTLLEQMKSSVTPQFVGYAAKLLGETPANIEKAVALALPAILSGTASASHVASGQTGQSVVSRLVSDPVNDGTLLHRLPALYQGTMTAAPIYRLGAQLLQAIFGSKLGKVTQTIAALSGVKPASAALLVNTLAPHVLSILGKRHRMSGEATATGLAHLFDAEHAALAAAVPAALSQLIGTPVSANATAAASMKSAAKPAATATASIKPAAAKAVSTVVASQTVAKSVEHRPTVTKQSYKWSSWLPVLTMYGLGAGGLALLLTSQTDVPSPNPVTGVKAVQVSPTPGPAPVPAVTAPTKAAEVAKPAAPAATPAATTPAKTAEIAKPAAPAATPAASAPAKTAEVAKSVPAAPVVPPAVKTADAAKSPNAAEPAAAPPKGVTSYFGTTPPPPEAAAKMNPAYKPDPVPAPTKVTAASPVPAPAPAAAAAPSLPVPVSPKGVTSFFGVTPPAVEPAAKMNPDYKPATAAPIADAAPAAAQTTATLPEVAKLPEVKSAAPVAVPAKPIDAAPVKSVAVPATPIAPIQPGVTSYFGTTPAPAEKTAIPNPEYRPAPAPVKEPSLAQAALNAVTALITPTPPRPAGVTNYYGSAPANVEAPARPNPDYKPTAASTAASTAPATTTAATPPAAKSSATTATAATTPAAPANALVPDAATCATKVANAVKKGRIIFQSSRAELKGTSIATLDRLATAFKACPNAKLKVEGHTDSTGQPDANKKLSQARAQTVADYLATKGIDKARVAPVGVGSVRPVAPNTTALNKARNRRIEFAVENL